MFNSRPNYNKLKTNLRLSINRLKLMEKKKTEMAMKARKEIADYISAGKEDRARIRVEHIVREDYYVEAMEIIEMYCDLLLARFGLIQSQKELDPGIEEAIASIIWVAPRMQADINELKAVSDQLGLKYSKEFAMACAANTMNNVNEKVMHKLSVQAPPKLLVERYMIEIAKSYSIPFEPDPTVMREDETYVGDLIDVDNSRGGGGSGSGGGGGGGGFLDGSKCATPPLPPMGVPAGYPPPANMGPVNPYPPPPPANPPNMGVMGPGMGMPPAPGVAGGFEPPPAYTSMANMRDGMDQSANGGAGALPPKNPPDAGFLNLPDLPNVPASPGSSVYSGTGGASAPPPPGAGSEDVDFDDLSRRFEELKRRK